MLCCVRVVGVVMRCVILCHLVVAGCCGVV